MFTQKFRSNFFLKINIQPFAKGQKRKLTLVYITVTAVLTNERMLGNDCAAKKCFAEIQFSFVLIFAKSEGKKVSFLSISKNLLQK